MAEIEEEAIGEIQVAEYVMLLLAIDTYAGYVEEQSGSDANDDHTRKGISLLRLADNQRGEALRDFLTEKLTREESKRSILRSFRVRVSTPEQAGRRALSVRTALNRGGTVTLNAVFDEARARRAVKTSIAAAMLDDAGEALDRYGSLPVRNMRIKKWIKDARALVGSGSSIHNPIEMAAAAVVDQVTTLKRQHAAEEGTTGADDVQEAQYQRGGTFEQLQVEATEAARTAMEVSGEDDLPPTKSEVIGIATAVAAAAASDVGNPNNVPEPLRMLDAEQRSAALTDGRVLVAAGAGAGKSTTLVARVKYLVEERKVNPSRILVSSFNKKAAEELKTKIGKAVGGDKAKAMQVGTLHGLFKAAITKYGTPEEQGMFRGKIGILTGSTTAAAVNRLWRKCLAEPKGDGTMQDAEAPSAKQMLMFKTKWSGNGVTPAQAKAQAKSQSQVQAALWYEMYEGLKGGIPGWRPACEGKAEAAREYDTFLRKNREVQGKEGDTYNARLGDFDDMVTVFQSILERKPEVRKRAQAAFDHVMIDESQDLNSTQSRVLELMTEHVTDGADGKSFWMVGDPDQCVSIDTLIHVSHTQTRRAGDLKAGDPILSYRNGEFVEQTVLHSIPSQWTDGIVIETEFGKRLHMSTNHKIWANLPLIQEEQHLVHLMHSAKSGRLVNLLAHTAGPKGSSQVHLEWTGSQFDEALRRDDISFQTTSRQDYRRVRRWFFNYRQALDFAQKLASLTDSTVQERLSVDNEKWPLVTAGTLVAGMSVAVLDLNGQLEVEQIIAVDRGVKGTFVDLDVDDASNFVGGGILSHNSIYAFRGARPDLLVDLDGKEGWKTRLIRTNYRCPPEIVTAANKLVANNVDRMDKEALASPGRAAGETSILASVYQDEAATAIAVAGEIKESWDEEGSEISDNAILCRTNKELNAFETALLMRGIPYARKGASSFLSSPETKAFLGYITLVTDTDTEKTQKALVDILNKPNRFFVSPDQVERAVDSALNNYARKMKQAKKTIDPMMALRDQAFQSDLIFVLKGTRSGFKADKGYEQLDELVRALDGLSAIAYAPTATTKDLFDAVLDMPGTKFKVNPNTGRIEGEMPVSFREELTASIKDFGDEEEDVQEEERPDEMNLGNISFLYELAKPNPEDPGDVEISPATPKGFWAKIGRLTEKAKELRIDLSVWDKEQDKLPPEDRKPAPGVYLGTVHCSPGDEPVLTTDGWVTMGQLDPEKHSLASYLDTCNQLFWGNKGKTTKRGYAFTVACNGYAGRLLALQTSRSRTRVTPDHRILVRFSEAFMEKYVVYLMRRGEWWRVGTCVSAHRPYRSGGVGGRLASEQGDAGWILGVYETRSEALAEEARIQGAFGLLGLTFESAKYRSLSSAQLHTIHESVKGVAALRARDLLESYGLDERTPLYTRGALDGEVAKRNMRAMFTTEARNFLAGYMEVPVVSEAFVACEGPREVWTKPEWRAAQGTWEHYEGNVYSLSVVPHRFYISGGAIVHNSVKGAQWPSVYVQMPKGRFPMEPRKRAGEDNEPVTPDEIAEQAAELESERRLAYVALTRPSKNLRIVAPGQIQGKPAGMSRFLDEAGLSLGENVPKDGEVTKTAKFFVEDGGVNLREAGGF